MRAKISQLDLWLRESAGQNLRCDDLAGGLIVVSPIHSHIDGHRKACNRAHQRFDTH